MRRPAVTLAAAAAALLSGIIPAAAVNNGLLDGATHPAIGFLVGSQDMSGCNGQAVGCSGMLLSPQLFLTTAECTEAFNDALATPGFISHVWVTFEPNDPLDCSKFVEVTALTTNPAFNTTKPDGGNVGMVELASPVSIDPVQLPTADELFSIPKSQSWTVVAFGTDSDLGGNVFTTARRFAIARSLGFTSERLALTFKTGGPTSACIGPLNEGGGAFVGTTNEVVAMVDPTKGGCAASATYQRLDVPDVRDFIQNYMTIP